MKDYSKVVMLMVNFPRFREIQRQILSQDVTFDGYSDNPHITLLYGIDNDIDNRKVAEVIQNCKFKKPFLTKLSLFENESDVLKFDVEGSFLWDINKKLKELPFKNDFPNFVPHLTIAYLKKGFGKYYANSLNKKYGNVEVEPISIQIGEYKKYSNFDITKNE